MLKTLSILLLLAPMAVHAETTGMKGVEEIKQCVVQKDLNVCHGAMTPSSYPIIDKFSSYGLMPCLPTNFTYKDETTSSTQTTVTSLLPDNGNTYLFRMVFVNSAGKVQLDLPQTLRVGLGPKWQEKLDFSEQLFLLMRQNMQDKLTCEVLHNLASQPKS